MGATDSFKSGRIILETRSDGTVGDTWIVAAPAGYVLEQDLGSSPDSYNSIFSDRSYEASSFQATGYTLTKVEVYMTIGAGAPLAQNVTARLYALDGTGSTPGTVLATADVKSAYTIANGEWVAFTFPVGQRYALSNGTSYAIGIQTVANDGSNYPRWNQKTGGSKIMWYSTDGSAWTEDSTSVQGTMRLYSGTP